MVPEISRGKNAPVECAAGTWTSTAQAKRAGSLELITKLRPASCKDHWRASEGWAGSRQGDLELNVEEWS